MDFARQVPLVCGSWHHVPVTANGQPAVAAYLDTEAWSINVLTLRDGLIAEVTSFIGQQHITTFGLPLSVSPDTGGVTAAASPRETR
jgi:RNA polymerase sigma-70 factor (ECF subfamily)